MACASGTTPHNAVFMDNQSKLIVLNRTPDINPPQIKIGKLFMIETTYIDCYCSLDNLKPPIYGNGPFWFYLNKHLRSFFKNNSYVNKYNWFSRLFINCFNFCKYLSAKILIPIYFKLKK